MNIEHRFQELQDCLRMAVIRDISVDRTMTEESPLFHDTADMIHFALSDTEDP